MIALHIALWIATIFLALVFLGAGGNKLIRGKAELEQMLPWAEDFSAKQLKIIAVAEILGAIGLILPEVTGIFPIITPVAALGLAATQVAAFRLHRQRGESRYLPVNVLLFVLALFVAVGRFFVHA